MAAWKVWNHLTNQRCISSDTPNEVTKADMKELERYVVLLYLRRSQEAEVKEARKQLFSYGNRKTENITPSCAALQQHVKLAAYQEGHIWGKSLKANPTLPSHSEWEWQRDS